MSRLCGVWIVSSSEWRHPEQQSLAFLVSTPTSGGVSIKRIQRSTHLSSCWRHNSSISSSTVTAVTVLKVHSRRRPKFQHFLTDHCIVKRLYDTSAVIWKRRNLYEEFYAMLDNFTSSRDECDVSRSACLCVCLWVCLSACTSQKPHVQTSRKFLYMSPVAMVRSSDDNAMLLLCTSGFVDDVMS